MHWYFNNKGRKKYMICLKIKVIRKMMKKTLKKILKMKSMMIIIQVIHKKATMLK